MQSLFCGCAMAEAGTIEARVRVAMATVFRNDMRFLLGTDVSSAFQGGRRGSAPA
jgi:hypothetical protein